MSCIWVKCLRCEYKFDIEDSINGNFNCPICGSKQFEYDEDIEKIDDYFIGSDTEDYEGFRNKNSF